jgi:hypothetical protein
MADAEPNVPVQGPADDTTVRQFVTISKELISAALSRDYIAVFKRSSEVLSVVGDLFGMFQTGNEAKSVTNEELESLKCDCESVKTSLQGVGASDNDPKDFDPATILVIIELVVKIIEWIRKRRNV